MTNAAPAPHKFPERSVNRRTFRAAGLVRCDDCGQLYSTYSSHTCSSHLYSVNPDPLQAGAYRIMAAGKTLAGGFTWADACAVADALESAS